MNMAPKHRSGWDSSVASATGKSDLQMLPLREKCPNTEFFFSNKLVVCLSEYEKSNNQNTWFNPLVTGVH